MTPVPQFLVSTVDRLGWVLVHSLWQFTLVGLTAMAIAGVLRRHSANARYAVLVAALVLMAVLPVVTWWYVPATRTATIPVIAKSEMAPTNQLPLPAGGEMTIGPDVATSLAVDDLGSVPTLPMEPAVVPLPSFPTRGWTWIADIVRPWLRELVAGWCVGVFLFALRPMLSWYTVHRLRTVGTMNAPATVQCLLQKAAERLHMRCAVEVLLSTLVNVPMVVGYFRPVILLPLSIVSGLPAMQLEGILAHELAHIRRRDYLVNLVQTLLETVFFYHPAMWWLSNRIRSERENCCDDLATAALGNPVEFARALLALEELRGSATALALGAKSGSLLHRVQRVVRRAPDERSVGAGGFVGVMIVAAVILGAGLWAAARAVGPDARTDEPPAITTQPTKPEGTPAAGEFTPAEIVERIEAAMRRFASVEYTAESSETRNANGFDNKEVLPVEGKSTVLYRCDGSRWFVDEHGFSYSYRQPGTTPKHEISGFDGDKHFAANEWQLKLGENDMAQLRHEPKVVFWRGARSADWLIAAIKTFDARVDRRETIDGHTCVVVVAEPFKPKPGKETNELPQQSVWHYEITLSPDQSWLPLKTEIHLDGKAYATETIEKLARTPEGVWYPEVIRFKQQMLPETILRKVTHITRFQLRDRFDDREFRWADPLPVGYDIVDYRQSRVWHNDPWWPDLAPWLAEHLNWPRPDLSGLKSMVSYADATIEGKPAPEIQAAEWFNGNPGGWNRAGRKATVLVFFGGDTIHPTPQWMASLKGLQERYKRDGLDIVGVTTSRTPPETIRRTIKSLDIRFPVAMDTKDEANQSDGLTYKAYQLKTYASVFLIDAAGRVLRLDPAQQRTGGPRDGIPPQLEALIRGQGLSPLPRDLKPEEVPQALIELDEALELPAGSFKQIEAEWKRLRRATVGTARLWVNLKFPSGEPAPEGEPAKLTIVPELKLLHSNTSGGWYVTHDESTSMASDDGCDMFGLPKGRYSVTVTRRGFASMERDITLPVADPGKPLEIVMLPGETIRGQVVDKAGEPIAGATIKAAKRHFDPAAPIRYTTEHLPSEPRTTNERGEFQFGTLFEGSYTLEISAVGFQTATAELIPVGKTDVRVVLQKQ